MARTEILHNVYGRLHVAVLESNNKPHQLKVPYSYFTIEGVAQYAGFCDDFGPMSLYSVSQFCDLVESRMSADTKPIALQTINESRILANAVFLVGSYLIMKHDMPVDEVAKRCSPLMPLLATYRDVSPGPQNFHLHVRDCWAGLWRAKGEGWVDFSPVEPRDPVRKKMLDIHN